MSAIMNENEEENADAQSHISESSQGSGPNDIDLNEDIKQKSEEEKVIIPESCYLNFSKNCKIEKLESKYLLVAHPYPALEGEMLILQPKKQDQKEGSE